MKGLFLRGKSWWIRFTPILGAPQERIALGTDDMAVAIVRAREIIERAEQGAREKAGSCEVEVLNYLLTISAEDCWGILTQEVKALHDSYLVINEGVPPRQAKGRIFISKAVILLCLSKKAATPITCRT
jgi:hypothetical protein